MSAIIINVQTIQSIDSLCGTDYRMSLVVGMTEWQKRETAAQLLGSMPTDKVEQFLRSEFAELFDDAQAPVALTRDARIAQIHAEICAHLAEDTAPTQSAQPNNPGEFPGKPAPAPVAQRSMALDYLHRLAADELARLPAAPAPAAPEGWAPAPGYVVTASRAAYFMERFKREEKLLGPHEQAAVDFVLAMLADAQKAATAPVAQPAGEPVEDLRERLAAAHDASLDDDHRGCRAILLELIREVDDGPPAAARVPLTAEHIPVSPVESARVDTNIGLVQLPPIRVSTDVAKRLQDAATQRGLVLQAHVRDLLSAPAAARVPLTDDQIVAALQSCDAEDHTQDGWVWRQRIKWARAIERAHGIMAADQPTRRLEN